MEGIGIVGTPMDHLFAVIVECKEALYHNGEVCTKEGDKFWVTLDDGYESSTSFYGLEKVPEEIQIFETRDEAEEFAKEWGGHPWWVNPKGYEIVRVKPRMVIQGYTTLKANEQ